MNFSVNNLQQDYYWLSVTVECDTTHCSGIFTLLYMPAEYPQLPYLSQLHTLVTDKLC
jgi:hypothetical protein